MKREGDKDKCCFCKKNEHWKNDRLKYKKWIEKKSNLSFVYFESNFIEVYCNT